MSNWTQPVCEDCWVRRHGARVPTRVTTEYRDAERCCWCGRETRSGIYERCDPATVAYPS